MIEAVEKRMGKKRTEGVFFLVFVGSFMYLGHTVILHPLNKGEVLKNQKLVIQNLSIMMHLGHSEEERNRLQEVLWTLSILPKNFVEKDSSSFICYALVSKKMEEYCLSQAFSLLESVALFCFKQLKQDFPQIMALHLKVEKAKPPIKNLKGGVFFECGDF